MKCERLFRAKDFGFQKLIWFLQMNKSKISPASPAGNDASPAAPSRQERVAAIKQAVAAGTYRVEDRTLADSLLRDLLWEQWERIRLLKP
jgi:hypothetical protein